MSKLSWSKKKKGSPYTAVHTTQLPIACIQTLQVTCDLCVFVQIKQSSLAPHQITYKSKAVS